MAEAILDIKIDNLSYENRKDVLSDIQIKVNKGDFIVLTGLSGCGKTSLIRLITGLVPNVYEGIYKGKIELKGKDILEYREGEIYKSLSYVFQDPKDQFFSTNVEDEIALVGENLGMERKALIKRVDEVINLLNIEKLRNRSIFELSGGEKQRVAIASALVYDSDIIIFDEPSAALDYKSTMQLKKILIDLKNMGKTIIIAEHRLFYLSDILDKMIYMKDGKVISIYKREELNEELRRKLLLRSFKEENLISNSNSCLGTKVFSCENINVKSIVNNLSFSLKKGEIMALLGANGTGKSTISKKICGLLSTKGIISSGKNKSRRLKNTYYLMQDVDSQIFYESVEAEIIVDIKDKSYLEKAANLLKRVDLFDKRLEHPQELSTGEKQRLTIATALLQKRELLILDEPTAGLDYKRMNEIAKLIKDISLYLPVIIVTHDIELIFKIANSALLLSKRSEKINLNGNEEKIISFLKK